MIVRTSACTCTCGRYRLVLPDAAISQVYADVLYQRCVLQLCMVQDGMQAGGPQLGAASNPALKQEDMPSHLLDFNLYVDIRTEPFSPDDQVLTF